MRKGRPGSPLCGSCTDASGFGIPPEVRRQDRSFRRTEKNCPWQICRGFQPGAGKHSGARRDRTDGSGLPGPEHAVRHGYAALSRLWRTNSPDIGGSRTSTRGPDKTAENCNGYMKPEKYCSRLQKSGKKGTGPESGLQHRDGIRRRGAEGRDRSGWEGLTAVWNRG